MKKIVFLHFWDRVITENEKINGGGGGGQKRIKFTYVVQNIFTKAHHRNHFFQGILGVRIWRRVRIMYYHLIVLLDPKNANIRKELIKKLKLE